MRIVIAGITGCRNRGVEALACTTIALLRQQFPGVQLSVLSQTPDYDAVRLAATDVVVLPDVFVETPTTHTRLLAVARAVLRKSWAAPGARAVRDADLVVISGGDLFGSDYGDYSRHLQAARYAMAHRVPVAFLGQSVGPFASIEAAGPWHACARDAALVTLRESLSAGYVRETLGLNGPRVHLTADSAFLLPVPSAAVVRRLRAACGLTDDQPTIALSVSQSISGYAGVSASGHVDAWRATVRQLLAVTDAQLLFVPHVQETWTGGEDRQVATMLMREFAYDARLRIAAADLTASEYKGLIGSCDFVIAERMHAAIAGLSSAVPTVVIGYSVKARGIVQDCMGDLAGADARNLVIPVQDFIKAPHGWPRIETAWRRRPDCAARLAAIVPTMQHRAAATGALLQDALRSRA